MVSGFGKIKRAIGDSVNSAIEFETQLAEIGTIANGTLGSLDNTGDAVRRISDAFNIPLADSARGLYETLSSQIAEGAKSIEFLEEAAAFAKGTITTTENAVALLSGTLNAFGKSADDAGHVASVFFRTIDLGNVTAEQLTTSFNRTTARARQLGVSFEEVAAAFATMTNRGVAHNEAATQLNAIMTALVKPSAAMTEALRQLGFSSSEVAIQTLGLAAC